MTGDVLCQLIFDPDRPFNWVRMLRMGVFGSVLIGPTLHYWFNWLAKILPGNAPATTIKRVIWDQGVFAPPFIAVIFGFLAMLQGKLDDLPRRMREDYPDAMKTNYLLWPAAQFLNFRFVPVRSVARCFRH